MRECDCGNIRRSGQAVCDRCAYLDGVHKNEQAIIMALRGRGGVSDMYQIAADAGTTVRSVQRNIAKLKRIGRVYRVTPHDINGTTERVLWALIDGLPAYRTV